MRYHGKFFPWGRAIISIKIVTDSTAYLSDQVIKKYGISVVPLTVNYLEESFLENRYADYHHFFEELRQRSAYPTTSQPSTGLFSETFQRLTADGSTVISIHISEKLSGTAQSAFTAAGMLPDRDIVVMDSMFTAAALAFFVIEAAEMAEAGRTKEEIIQRLTTMKENTRLYFLVHSLEFLRRGGRIGGASAILGTILQLKPILHIEDGSIQLFHKVRTWDKACSRILEETERWLTENGRKKVRLGFLHVDNPAEAVMMKQNLNLKRPDLDIAVYPIGPVIGSHVGPGCIGVAMTCIEE